MCQSGPVPSSESGNSTISRGRSWLDALGPGILVAATGVGAGDLAGGALAGARLKLAVLWVCLIGAALKFVLCEGLARWQLSTGTSVADGVFKSTHPVVRFTFLIYVAAWSFCIGGMLMSACGECAQAILPIGDPSSGRIIHGSLQSLFAILLVRLGGFRLFERMMTVFIGVMFVTVVFVAVLSGPDWADVIRGLLIPSIPHAEGKGIPWTLTLMAGVGGTLTMLCYGSWIREKSRADMSALRDCRVDLAAGYLMTAAFGVCMVILGSRLPVDQGLKGANLITQISRDMQQQLGEIGIVAGWMFRIGAWGAVFSSLLGVWQSVPALICEMLPESEEVSNTRIDPITNRRRYNTIQLLLGIVPACGLPYSLANVQKVAGVTGALFLPMFALALLLLGCTATGKQSGFRNGLLSTSVLIICLLMFGYLAAQRFLL
jgi:Mn2+/Fe2+ NRAMP family transporter